MIKILKYQLLTGWHPARWIRLVLGIALLAQAIATSDLLVGAFAFLLLGQVVANTSCSSSSGCSIPQAKIKDRDTSAPGT